MTCKFSLKLFFVIIFVLVSSFAKAGSETLSGIETGITSLSNIPGAIYFSDRKYDSYGLLKLHWGRYYDLEPGASFVWQVDVEQRVFSKWAWSDTFIPGVQLRWSKKYGIGPRAPRLSAWLHYQYLNYRDDGCNGPLTTGGLRWERRTAERFRIRIGADIDHRRSADGSVYDLDGRSFHITGITELTSQLQLSAGIGRRRGDIAIHSLDGWSPAGQRWWASGMTGVAHRVYQIAGQDTDFYTLELALVNNPRTTTRLGWRRDKSDTTRRDYRRDTVELSLVHRF